MLTGAGSLPFKTSGQPVMSGLLFAYNDDNIRVWIANKGNESMFYRLFGFFYCSVSHERHLSLLNFIQYPGYSDRVLCIRDGYARDDDGYRCDQGEFRVRGWTSLGQRVQRFRFRLNGLDPDSIPDMSALKVNIRQWDSLTNYVQVQVRCE